MVVNMETISSFPWIRERWLIRSQDGSVVAEVRPWDASGCRQEDQANANVIAASPCLYQELKYAIECLEQGCTPGSKWMERAINAVSKAEGIVA
jgi:hypothetical protein